MKIKDIEKVLKLLPSSISKWELDNVIWADRLNDPRVLEEFLTRILELNNKVEKTKSETEELKNLEELLADMTVEECKSLTNLSEEDEKTNFIESLARKSAIETLCNSKLSIDTMNIACKLSPNDFILCAKRTQDLITAIHGLVIKGESLSKDVAGA